MAEKTVYSEPTLEKQLKGHRKAVTAVYFSPNEQQVASGSLDNSVLLWDLRDTMRSYRFQGHDEAVLDVTFSPSGKYMASASRDKTVRLWVPTVTGSTGMFKAHSQTVRSVQFSHDNTKLITASDDKIVKLWSTDKLKFLSSFVGHTNWVRCARMSRDGSIIASCSDDKTIKLWNPESGECIHNYKLQNGHGLCLAWHPSSCYIAVGTSHGNVKLYDVRTHNIVQYYSIHTEDVTQLAFHPSGSYILTSSKDSKMKILDLLEGRPLFTLSGHNGPANAVNFSPSGELFASAGDDKLVFIWRTNFTQLSSDTKENDLQNHAVSSSASASRFTTKGKNQGRAWYLCYHSSKYPVTTFVHIDDPDESRFSRQTSFGEPKANSTLINVTVHRNDTPINVTESRNNLIRPNLTDSELFSDDNNIGDISHIPRKPPTPTTYTVPTLVDRSVLTDNNYIFGSTIPTFKDKSVITEDSDLFGMIKLKENDVCYTSGSIEWVGRKRCYPLNTGFKIINESFRQAESSPKKCKRLDNTYTLNEEKIKECDCPNVLPTVNAIVDHLNALHEAVDIVDLRLNTLENVVGK